MEESYTLLLQLVNLLFVAKEYAAPPHLETSRGAVHEN